MDLAGDAATHAAIPVTVRIARSTIEGTVEVPGSKSATNRALVIAGLARGTSRISGGLAGDDAESMASGLSALGVGVVEDSPAARSAAWTITGCGGDLAPGPTVVDANLAGTTLRFLTAVAALGSGGITITGRGGLLRRPVGPLIEALRECGAQLTGSGEAGDRAPILVGARVRPLGGHVTIDASQSSQFVTAMLLAAPCFDEDLVLEHRGLSARGFVELTIEQMRAHGALVEQDGEAVRVRAATAYQPGDEHIPPDASAASHLFTAAAASGGAVTVSGLERSSSQPDYEVLAVFEAFGATVARHDDASVGLCAPSRLSPVEVDLGAMPDQLPNVAVLAALAGGRSRIGGVGVTRFHETDRIAAVAAELAKVGVLVESDDDSVVVHGGTAHGGVAFFAYDDHRMAMALAALAAALGDCTIAGAESVSKTYRDFWTDAAALGLRVGPG
ncbi:MAG TPA: 3-phosphoshikimate 1-carboxyvinyltransferase [Acidimicrobiales bacterium]|nr:3-phosphoshikimate 1-carboxyvinyltransferase [Acidimicrobiales bacterium]